MLNKKQQNINELNNQIYINGKLDGQEEERKRLARELHDGIGQMLTGIRLYIEQLDDLPFVTDKQRHIFEDLRKLVAETLEETRQISFNLMPSVLYDFGLEPAIRILSERVSQQSGMQINVKIGNVEKYLIEPVGIALYRITQEALTNCMKYAGAKTIEIDLQSRNNQITLSIRDDGQGFKYVEEKYEKSTSISSGLRNMHIRAEQIGARLTIKSEIGEGTIIRVTVPI
ncbi:MAG: sensor histidine kinase [Siphonobacter sp.]